MGMKNAKEYIDRCESETYRIFIRVEISEFIQARLRYYDEEDDCGFTF